MYDIALIRLNHQVNTIKFPPVKLPSSKYFNNNKKYKTYYVMGFGAGKGGDKPSGNAFRYAEFEIDSQKEFQFQSESIYNRDTAKRLSKTKDLFSASGKRNLSTQVCKGDSGGPIFVETSRNGEYMVGLTSMVDKYCDQGYSVFTDIRPHLQWIKQKVRS